MSEAIKNRYEFIMLYDVENGNPNGDPDAGNMPRLDPETGHGIVTDVCIKRKIRNYVEMTKAGADGFDIYVRQDTTLNSQDAKGVAAVESEKDKGKKSEGFRAFMCSNFYDIRTFGAVMTTAAKSKELSNVAGQVRGPVQMAFGRSVSPIVPQEITITRVAITTEEKKDDKGASTEMGRKHIVPYALYSQAGFISANLAQRITNFSEDDLELLWESILNMFEFDRSAARGLMTLRKLIIFKHTGEHPELGSAAAHDLFDLVSVDLKEGVNIPRAYSDYIVAIGNAPEGVEIIEKR